MASADLRHELNCSICKDIYTDPVTLRCGHSFCQICIDGVLDTDGGYGEYSCPDCRATFQRWPPLQKNITLCNVVENFLASHPHQEEITGICCTYCVDSPVSAVRSCLHCEASLCDNHLRVHSKEPEHVLTDPSTSLETRKCSVHKKILEYYCTEDAACICASCSLAGEHRGHRVEMLDEASEKKKKKLRNVLHKLTTKKKKTEERVQSLEERKRKGQEKAAGKAERVTALCTDIRRRVDDLEKKILSDISKWEENVSLSDVIQNLEIKMDELSRKMRHIEELCNMTDPLTVLQDPDTGDLCDPEEEGGDEDTGGHGGDEDTGGHDGGDEDTGGHGGDEDTGGHDGGDEDTGGHDGGDRGAELISHISHTLSTMIRDINVIFHMQDPADILLDVNTAANNLLISDDLKTATWMEITQNYPETSERFQYNQVMSGRRFTSGRHYWDVEIRGIPSGLLVVSLGSVPAHTLSWASPHLLTSPSSPRAPSLHTPPSGASSSPVSSAQLTPTHRLIVSVPALADSGPPGLPLLAPGAPADRAAAAPQGRRSGRSSHPSVRLRVGGEPALPIRRASAPRVAPGCAADVSALASGAAARRCQVPASYSDRVRAPGTSCPRSETQGPARLSEPPQPSHLVQARPASQSAVRAGQDTPTSGPTSSRQSHCSAGAGRGPPAASVPSAARQPLRGTGGQREQPAQAHRESPAASGSLPSLMPAWDRQAPPTTFPGSCSSAALACGAPTCQIGRGGASKAALTSLPSQVPPRGAAASPASPGLQHRGPLASPLLARHVPQAGTSVLPVEGGGRSGARATNTAAERDDWPIQTSQHAPQPGMYTPKTYTVAPNTNTAALNYAPPTPPCSQTQIADSFLTVPALLCSPCGASLIVATPSPALPPAPPLTPHGQAVGIPTPIADTTHTGAAGATIDPAPPDGARHPQPMVQTHRGVTTGGTGRMPKDGGLTGHPERVPSGNRH
ncbi:unnamed protein product [Ranitomeya imitator]|uniref:Uncharacterized protein n=1 Tax=Ranitomeya imitator TaxID=111125 RepID=A0ABN9MRS2_9NEOB|nr:unnamed protein product [Ranitomeya imitator]